MADHFRRFLLAAGQEVYVQGLLWKVGVLCRYERHFDRRNEPCMQFLHIPVLVQGPVGCDRVSDGKDLSGSVLQFEFLFFIRKQHSLKLGIREDAAFERGAGQGRLEKA